MFNLYSKKSLTEPLRINIRFLLNAERLNNIRYADDIVVFKDSMKNFQELINYIKDVSCEYGLDFNKSKFMVISNKLVGSCFLMVSNTPIERLSQYFYLGTMIN